MTNNTEKYIEEFLSHLKYIKRRADSTIKEYRKILNSYKSYIDQMGINKIAFLKYLEDNSNLSKRTIRLRVVVIRSFLNYLFENQYIDGIQYWKDAYTESPNQVPKGLTEDQLEIIFKHINNNEYDKNFFGLLLKMGLRISEALNLKRENFIVHRNYAEIVVDGKGSKERILKISFDYAKQILNLTDNYIFDKLLNNKMVPTSRTMQRRFKKYVIISNEEIEKLNKEGANINLINATPHALRHTCAKKLLNSGKNIEEVRYILGHTSIQTTGIYLRSEQHTSLLDEI
jgi:integrase/recombinase XerD